MSHVSSQVLHRITPEDEALIFQRDFEAWSIVKQVRQEHGPAKSDIGRNGGQLARGRRSPKANVEKTSEYTWVLGKAKANSDAKIGIGYYYKLLLGETRKLGSTRPSFPNDFHLSHVYDNDSLYNDYQSKCQKYVQDFSKRSIDRQNVLRHEACV